MGRGRSRPGTTLKSPDYAGKSFTAVPDVMLRFPTKLKLARLDLLVALTLMTYWRSPTEMPWPSKETIASALGVDPQTVRRSVKKMEGLGYIKRIARPSAHGDNKSNAYDMRGLAKAVNNLAKEESALRAAREAEDKRRAATPRSAKLALIKGGSSGE